MASKNTRDSQNGGDMNQNNPLLRQGPNKSNNNQSKKVGGESLKLEEEEGKIEFIDHEGRPDNFLGLQDVSSGDQEQKFKYGCTDELEEALSSVQMMNSGNQNRNMYTGSESLDDILKGYLKSGKVLESKLQQISTLKNAIISLERVHGRASINEMPVSDENEDDDEVEAPANEDSQHLVSSDHKSNQIRPNRM